MKGANVFSVLKWEFKKHIKNPTFLIFTFLIPALLALAGFLPGYIVGKTSIEARDLWLLDETSQLAPLVEAVLADSRYVVEVVQGNIEDLKEKVGAGEADAVLHITQETLSSGAMQLFARDLMDFNRGELEQMVQPAFTQYRLQLSGISPQEFAAILAPTSVEMFSVSGEKENPMAMAVPLLAGMLLFISVLFSGQVLMQSVIKDKRNRIVEILLSSLSASELLAGKVLAFGGLTLIQVAIWLGMGLSVASRFVDLSLLGLDITLLFKALPYFLLGYLLLATLFASLAATMKDAESGSQAHGLVIMIPMFPLMLSMPIMMAPNGIFARVLSYIPVFTPAAMLMRIGVATVPLWELVLTSIILLVSTLFFLDIGARIYRGSLLKFDTAASFREIMAMIRRREP